MIGVQRCRQVSQDIFIGEGKKAEQNKNKTPLSYRLMLIQSIGRFLKHVLLLLLHTFISPTPVWCSGVFALFFCIAKSCILFLKMSKYLTSFYFGQHLLYVLVLYSLAL